MSNSYFEIKIKVDESLKNNFQTNNNNLSKERPKEDDKQQKYMLTKEQTRKVVNYASKLCDHNLRKGYSYLLSKEKLTKQMMHHTNNWRPTSNPNLSKEDAFQVSLLVG